MNSPFVLAFAGLFEAHEVTGRQFTPEAAAADRRRE
jgi:hypothetical protein